MPAIPLKPKYVLKRITKIKNVFSFTAVLGYQITSFSLLILRY